VGRYRAVLLDAYGTLVELDDPFGRLRDAVRRHLGVEVGGAIAERAFRDEMRFYSDRCHTAADARSLAELRMDCARLLLSGLRIEADPDAADRVLTEAVAFRVLPGAHELFAGLAAAAVPAAVVSNWDYTLRRTLTGLGIDPEAVVTCGETGVRKPDPRIFEEALGRLGIAADDALHVGDNAETDGAGAAAAGIDVRILDRTGTADGRDTIAALTDVLELL
jgi:HAD superfamily hydrolase (TIGR01549 family)